MAKRASTTNPNAGLDALNARLASTPCVIDILDATDVANAVKVEPGDAQVYVVGMFPMIDIHGKPSRAVKPRDYTLSFYSLGGFRWQSSSDETDTESTDEESSDAKPTRKRATEKAPAKRRTKKKTVEQVRGDMRAEVKKVLDQVYTGDDAVSASDFADANEMVDGDQYENMSTLLTAFVTAIGGDMEHFEDVDLS